MYQKRNLNLFVIIAIIILASCATSGKIYYKYNNVHYETPEQALAPQKADCEKLLSEIAPTENPVGGVAVYIAPTTKYVRENIMVYNGPPISDEKKEQMFDFSIKSLGYVYRCDYEIIEKRRIFDKVIYTSNDNPETASFSEDYAILIVKKDSQRQYFIKRKNNPSDLISVEISRALPPVQRLILWLDKIQEKAREK